MLEREYRSAVVAPLVARGSTLGAMSLLRLGDGEPYGEDDLHVACELAVRAAMALDNARLYSELRGVEQRLEAVLVNLAEAITMEDERGRTVFANRAAAELVGVPAPEDVTRARPGELISRFVILDEHGKELGLEDMPGRKLFAGEQPAPLLVRNIVRATGEERWLMVRCSPVIDPDSNRVVYAVNVFENITEVKRAELAESFMAEASRVLSSSTDYVAALARVARLATPQIADWCAIDVLDEAGEIERVATHHADADKLGLLQRLQREYRPTLDERVGIGEVLRTGQARLYSDVDDEKLIGYARGEEHLQLLRGIGTTSVIVVPILGAMRAAIGTITLASAGVRRLTRGDLGVAVRLGRRAGSAVERARIYTERARIAHVLQRSLLPESLPEIPAAEVHALYAAAGELNEVGGDFYDVFEYDARRWMLVVGDVCGKGPRAAGATALARHTLRATAMSAASSTEMLATLHRALRVQPRGADMCTVCLVTMAHAEQGARLKIALAGHQPPLLIDAHGGARQLGQPGTLLGVIEPLNISETEATLRPGETLLLYTDGVTEAGRPHRQLGERGLREVCERSPSLALPALLEAIETAALERAEGQLHDDIALLALRLAGTGPDTAKAVR
jgi:PAS domain S-box-containing protein